MCMQYEHRWGENYWRGLRMPLDRFSSDQHQHLTAHCTRNLHTTMVLAECSEHRNAQLCTLWLLSGSYPQQGWI